MKSQYHKSITLAALEKKISPTALQIILDANLHQDVLTGQIGHPEYHFDSSAFTAGNAYMEKQRNMIVASVRHENPPVRAWQAFGRLIHAAQDFYAHSNYVVLWAEKYKDTTLPDPEAIDPLDMSIMTHPGLRSGKIYNPFELLTTIPWLEKMIKPLLPHDSHAWLNMDTPERTPLFPWVMAAARSRTRCEFTIIVEHLTQDDDKELPVRFTALISHTSE
jgi:hypothetical protein